MLCHSAAGQKSLLNEKYFGLNYQKMITSNIEHPFSTSHLFQYDKFIIYVAKF
jgi:hypothetical protein